MSKKNKFNIEHRTHLVTPPRMEGKPKNVQIRNVRKKKKG
jgi:hypothetical protein